MSSELQPANTSDAPTITPTTPRALPVISPPSVVPDRDQYRIEHGYHSTARHRPHQDRDQSGHLEDVRLPCRHFARSSRNLRRHACKKACSRQPLDRGDTLRTTRRRRKRIGANFPRTGRQTNGCIRQRRGKRSAYQIAAMRQLAGQFVESFVHATQRSATSVSAMRWAGLKRGRQPPQASDIQHLAGFAVGSPPPRSPRPASSARSGARDRWCPDSSPLAMRGTWTETGTILDTRARPSASG
jgi:hypothetical protein